jgi:IS5 family transposase
MSQLTFGDAEYAGKRKTTRREVFLCEMDQVVPWKSLVGLIEPFYPLAGRGRQPYPLETMLRVHLMQNWFGLSDPGMEEALYEVASMRQFARLSLLEAMPDESTILRFRHLLEQNEIASQILERVNAHLNRKGLLLKRGTMVDATIIEAPTSTKNASGERDPEMHQTKKGNDWHFGMKATSRVDADSGWCIPLVTTPANESDVAQVDRCCTGKRRYGDAYPAPEAPKAKVDGSPASVGRSTRSPTRRSGLGHARAMQAQSGIETLRDQASST